MHHIYIQVIKYSYVNLNLCLRNHILLKQILIIKKKECFFNIQIVQHICFESLACTYLCAKNIIYITCPLRVALNMWLSSMRLLQSPIIIINLCTLAIALLFTKKHVRRQVNYFGIKLLSTKHQLETNMSTRCIA